MSAIKAATSNTSINTEGPTDAQPMRTVRFIVDCKDFEYTSLPVDLTEAELNAIKDMFMTGNMSYFRMYLPGGMEVFFPHGVLQNSAIIIDYMEDDDDDLPF